MPPFEYVLSPRLLALAEPTGLLWWDQEAEVLRARDASRGYSVEKSKANITMANITEYGIVMCLAENCKRDALLSEVLDDHDRYRYHLIGEARMWYETNEKKWKGNIDDSCGSFFYDGTPFSYDVKWRSGKPGLLNVNTRTDTTIYTRLSKDTTTLYVDGWAWTKGKHFKFQVPRNELLPIEELFEHLSYQRGVRIPMEMVE